MYLCVPDISCFYWNTASINESTPSRKPREKWGGTRVLVPPIFLTVGQVVIFLAMFLKVFSIFEVHLPCFPRQRLENDLRVKENSISIDQSKCMTLRSSLLFDLDFRILT